MLDPEDYQELSAGWPSGAEREAEINQLIAILHDKLERGRHRGQVAGRAKHFYSIRKKMHEGGREFDQIYDIIAFRVLISYRARLLRRARRHPLALDAGARPLQGLHRDAEAEHVPVAAHHGHRAQGRAVEVQIRTARDAPDRRAGHRRALALQGEEERPRQVRRRLHLAPPADGVAEGSQGSARVPRHGPARPLPGRGLRLHAQGRRQGAARGLDADRLRLRRAHRRRAPLRRRQGQRQARAAALHAPERRHRRGHHLARRSIRAATGSRSSSPPAPARRSTSGSRSRSGPARSPSGRSCSSARPGSTACRRPTLLASDEMRKLLADLGFPSPDDLLASVGYGKTSVQQVLGQACARRPSTRSTSRRRARRQGAAEARRRGQDPRGRRPPGAVRQVLRAGPRRRHRGLHHPRPRAHRARARLPDRGQERAREGADHRRRVGRRRARQAPGPDRRLHRPRPARSPRRDHRRDLLAPRQHHQGRHHRHRGPEGHQQLRRRGRRPPPAPGDHAGDPRGQGRLQRRARPHDSRMLACRCARRARSASLDA